METDTCVVSQEPVYQHPWVRSLNKQGVRRMMEAVRRMVGSDSAKEAPPGQLSRWVLAAKTDGWTS